MSKRATIREVAKQAGVSPATVSLALRDDRQIPEATRLRVHEAAAVLGYTRHPFLSLLGRSRGGGRALDAEVPVVLLTHSHLTVYKKLPEQGKARGYRITAHAPGAFVGKAGSRRLRAMGVAAIFLGLGCDEVDFGDFDWSRFVVIILDSASNLISGHHFSTASFGPMHELYLKLIERGFRRIGALVVHAGTPHPDDPRRRGAFLEACQNVPAARRLPFVWLRPASEEWMPEAEVYVERHRPDVVIVMNSHYVSEMRSRFGLSAAALVVAEADLPWCMGWRMLDQEKNERALDVLDRNVRAGLVGIDGPLIAHQIQPTWNAGGAVK